MTAAEQPEVGMFTSKLESILEDRSIDTVVETTRSERPEEIRDLLVECLRSGKHVIASNRECLGAFGARLAERSRQYDRFLGFAAALSGVHQAVPAFSRTALMRRIAGIFDSGGGMVGERENWEIDTGDGIEQQAHPSAGGRERSADRSGRNALNKLILTVQLAFGIWLDRDEVPKSGFGEVEALDFEFSGHLGYLIKPLGLAFLTSENRVAAYVGPCFIPRGHPLASVGGGKNALLVHDSFGETQMSVAEGSGEKAAVKGLLSDLLALAWRRESIWPGEFQGQRAAGFTRLLPPSPHYVRLRLHNEAGTFAKVSRVFARNGISFEKIYQEANQREGGRYADVGLIVSRCRRRMLERLLGELRPVFPPDFIPVKIPVEGNSLSDIDFEDDVSEEPAK